MSIIKDQLQNFGVNQVIKMLESDPAKNLDKVMAWVDRLDKHDSLTGQRKMFHQILDDKDGIWYKFILSLWDDLDEGIRTTFFRNFIVNASLVGTRLQDENKAKHDCNIPWAILMDPTSACNLSCTGCWAAEYGDRQSMSYETLNEIIRQGKELGTFMYIYSGGEPLVRKKDIIRLCEEHDDCMFLAFTNGILIDEEFADEMLRVKNFIPAISIEGFEADTDDRRGAGTYQKVIKAMEILKSKKAAFGASCCYTRKNTDTIGSGEFIDDLMARGAKFAWFFTYMPIGVGSPTDLLVTPEQREFMYHQIHEFRETKPIFTMDFWNDGEYVDGCIAGGRYYIHINANGDIEPCAFIHYSDSGIYEKTLLEAYKSPLLQQYRKNQPFNKNYLRPCPLLDNQGKLAEMVHASGAHSTDLAQPEDVDNLCAKCMTAADNWTPVADQLYNEREDRLRAEAETSAKAAG